MSDSSSQPTQPLTDEQRFELWRAFAGGNSVQYFSGFQDQHWTAGVDRLAVALAPMLDGEYEKVRNENRRLRAENTAQAARIDAAEKFARNWTGAPHEVTSQLDQYLQEDYGTTAIAHCGRAILTALGLDQDGEGQA